MVDKNNIKKIAENMTLSVINISASEEFESLGKVLNAYKIPCGDYSLGTEKENKVSLFFENGYWKVTFVERGHRQSEQDFLKFSEAGEALIYSIGVSKRKAANMSKHYKKFLASCGKNDTPNLEGRSTKGGVGYGK